MYSKLLLLKSFGANSWLTQEKCYQYHKIDANICYEVNAKTETDWADNILATALVTYLHKVTSVENFIFSLLFFTAHRDLVQNTSEKMMLKRPGRKELYSECNIYSAMTVLEK